MIKELTKEEAEAVVGGTLEGERGWEEDQHEVQIVVWKT